jgi:hypothetical protein
LTEGKASGKTPPYWKATLPLKMNSAAVSRFKVILRRIMVDKPENKGEKLRRFF